MKDRVLLASWLAAVVGITFIHDPVWLTAVLAAAMALAGRSTPSLLKRALIAIALVNVAVSLGFVLSASIAGDPWGLFVLRLNLRVLLLTFLTLWFAGQIDLVRAVSFSRSLQFLVVLALSQIKTFQRLLVDYRMAFRSRNFGRPDLKTRARSAGRQAGALLEKAELQAAEVNLGMRARGFFDDRA
ncbi:MAG: hypothetical protein V2J20_13255 [Wenzhouxiangella sp.]|nr:hypothetical protein [Wenzhouxiangella sp.]